MCVADGMRCVEDEMRCAGGRRKDEMCVWREGGGMRDEGGGVRRWGYTALEALRVFGYNHV